MLTFDHIVVELIQTLVYLPSRLVVAEIDHDVVEGARDPISLTSLDCFDLQLGPQLGQLLPE